MRWTESASKRGRCIYCALPPSFYNCAREDLSTDLREDIKAHEWFVVPGNYQRRVGAAGVGPALPGFVGGDLERRVGHRLNVPGVGARVDHDPVVRHDL